MYEGTREQMSDLPCIFDCMCTCEKFLNGSLSLKEYTQKQYIVFKKYEKMV